MKYLLILFLFTACQKLHKGELKTERGFVIAKQYSPDTRDVVTGTGFSSNGSIVITSHSIGEDEKFNLVFRCEHNVMFTISDPNIYAKVKEGDSVTIRYYELLTKKNKVYEYETVDASPISKN